MERKKRIGFKIILGFAVVVLSGFLVVGVASASITDSSHNFSGDAWSGGKICGVCHTPHNSDNTLVPLWNHATTEATFTLYTSTTLDAVPGQPDGVSKACLSCHDGTVALDSFGGTTGTVDMLASSPARLGTNLSNDHPVSFIYDSALADADGYLETPASTSTVDDGTIPLFAGKVECSSCHDVHNSAGVSKMLVKSNVESALCMSCHIK